LRQFNDTQTQGSPTKADNPGLRCLTPGGVIRCATARAWHPNIVPLPRDLVLYLARHECGTKICREKGIEYARRLLGHTNITTTQRYMHLDEKELADAQDLIE
jgi:integrase